MAKDVAKTERPAVHPLVAFRTQVEQRADDFRSGLPAHIPVERFMRVLMTSVERNRNLLQADRESLLTACKAAANDGLLPDGKEGAIVTFRTKVKRNGEDAWIDACQWMPMVFGILKKIRNSGEIATITARVVYGGDDFKYWVDDEGEHIQHVPADEPDTTIVRRVYAMARTKDGELFVEPLTAQDVEKIRDVSRAKDRGPWVDWWEEMAKKSAIRRLAKRLPMSTDLDDLVRRDDALYDMEGASDRNVKPDRPSLGGRLDRLAAPRSAPPAIEMRAQDKAIDHDPDTGEIRDEERQDDRQDDRQEERQEERDPPASKKEAAKPKETKAKPAATKAAEKPQEDQRPAEEEEDRRADEARQGAQERDAQANDGADDGEVDESDPDDREETPVDVAYKRGWEHRMLGRGGKAIPADLQAEGREKEKAGWQAGWRECDEKVKADDIKRNG